MENYYEREVAAKAGQCQALKKVNLKHHRLYLIRGK